VAVAALQRIRLPELQLHLCDVIHGAEELVVFAAADLGSGWLFSWQLR
jgi:hypothetical protein